MWLYVYPPPQPKNNSCINTLKVVGIREDFLQIISKYYFETGMKTIQEIQLQNLTFTFTQ